MNNTRWSKTAVIIQGLFLGIIISRLLYEGFFPTLASLGRPLGVFVCAGCGAGFAYLGHKKIDWWLWLPLWLNLIWLFDPTVHLVSSRLIFMGTIWLIGVGAMIGRAIETPTTVRWWRWSKPTSWLLIALIPLYGLTLGRTVGAHDTFEFQVVIPKLGIVHPTGYPLYLLLGKLWTLIIPFGPVAWRINVGTAVYGVATAVLLYRLILLSLGHITQRQQPYTPSITTRLSALFATLSFALAPTFWSQAAEAEVYTLHNLLVAGGLLLIINLIYSAEPKRGVKTAALLGLSLTNHLTTLFLLPAAGLAYLNGSGNRFSFKEKIANLRSVIPAGLLPLVLYVYLPWRWRVVNQEPMGLGRFWQWVSGGQFQGALQWWAWWHDPTRYEVVGRLFLAEWPLYLLIIAAIGSVWLFFANWRIASVLLLTWLGFTFYCLNYYVPDLNVFLLPAHLIIAVWLGVGLFALDYMVRQKSMAPRYWDRWPLLLFLLFLPLVANRYTAVDRSAPNRLVTWGNGVLAQDLAQGSTILADSEKIAPLFYLQQAEGIRVDLDIKVLFTEAEYRQVLDARLGQGETVYLARFLPNLAGQYYLRSAGPLTEVSDEPLLALPSSATPTKIDFGSIQLIGVELDTPAAVDSQAAAITLYWTALEATDQALQVYVRWADGRPINGAGTHPANDNYPTVAWRSGEIVPDFHLLPLPGQRPQQLAIEVALAPAFTPAEELAWQAVATADFATLPSLKPSDLPLDHRPLRILLGDSALTAVSYPTQIRPHTELEITSTGQNKEAITFALASDEGTEFIPLDHITMQGEYRLIAHNNRDNDEGKNDGTAVCGWLRPEQRGCVVGTVAVSGISLPEGATNFADLIALRQISIDDTILSSGGELPITIEWQALAPIPEDYTVFVQILTEDDQLVGQVDSWPLQGTLPTTAWQTGDIVSDPYRIPLKDDLPSGNYRLIVGFYRLADLQRLPVVDDRGQLLDDKFEVKGLIVP